MRNIHQFSDINTTLQGLLAFIRYGERKNTGLSFKTALQYSPASKSHSVQWDLLLSKTRLRIPVSSSSLFLSLIFESKGIYHCRVSHIHKEYFIALISLCASQARFQREYPITAPTPGSATLQGERNPNVSGERCRL